MKKPIRIASLLFFVSLFILSCTKRDAPAPNEQSGPNIPEYYFKGSFGEDILDITETNHWSNSVVGGSGSMHILSSNQYNYVLGNDSYWTKYNDQNPTIIESILNLSFQKIKYNVDKDYSPAEKDHYDLWQSGIIIPQEAYHPNPVLNTNQGWNICFTDGSNKQWVLQKFGNDPQGIVTIFSKSNVNAYSAKYVKVTGYISCILYENNHPENKKILQGTFSQLVNNYYENPVVMEY